MSEPAAQEPSWEGEFNPARAKAALDAARADEKQARADRTADRAVLRKLGIDPVRLGLAALDPETTSAAPPAAAAAAAGPSAETIALAAALGVEPTDNLLEAVEALKARRPKGPNSAEFRGQPPPPRKVTRDELAYLTPEAIVDLRRAGLIEGVSAAD
jgi:hypothetical protein